MKMRLAWIAMVAIALSACASAPKRSALPSIGNERPSHHQAMRLSNLGVLGNAWSMSGRVAVSAAGEGGSGRIEWHQSRDRFDVALSAPVTRQSWRIVGGPGNAVLEGLAGGPRSGADASELVFEATRWRIPVNSLASWLVGGLHRDGNIQYGADGRVARIDEDGWVVTYSEWFVPDGWPLDIEMPGRIEATRGDARVRLAIDTWTLNSESQQ